MITQRFSRKQFLKLAALLMSVYPLKLFYDAGKSASDYSQVINQQTLPLDLPEGISFHGELIAQRDPGKTRFFSARCPHLGCLINRLENEQLVCPCHGSRFSVDGKVLEGPAFKDLTPLSYVTDVSNRQITVTLPK